MAPHLLTDASGYRCACTKVERSKRPESGGGANIGVARGGDAAPERRLGEGSAPREAPPREGGPRRRRSGAASPPALTCPYARKAGAAGIVAEDLALMALEPICEGVYSHVLILVRKTLPKLHPRLYAYKRTAPRAARRSRSRDPDCIVPKTARSATLVSTSKSNAGQTNPHDR